MAARKQQRREAESPQAWIPLLIPPPATTATTQTVTLSLDAKLLLQEQGRQTWLNAALLSKSSPARAKINPERKRTVALEGSGNQRLSGQEGPLRSASLTEAT